MGLPACTRRTLLPGTLYAKKLWTTYAASPSLSASDARIGRPLGRGFLERASSASISSMAWRHFSNVSIVGLHDGEWKPYNVLRWIVARRANVGNLSSECSVKNSRMRLIARSRALLISVMQIAIAHWYGQCHGYLFLQTWLTDAHRSVHNVWVTEHLQVRSQHAAHRLPPRCPQMRSAQ